MAKAIGKSSPYYLQYKKARRAVQSRVAYYKSQGYDVSKIKIPAIPKTITEKSVSRLEKISGQYIKAHSKVAVEVQTRRGVQTKIVSGTVASKRRRHEGAVKAARTRKATKEYREKYGLPKGYTIDPDTGEKHETPAHRKKREAAEAKYWAIADYDYDTMGEIADYEPPTEAGPSGKPKKHDVIYADPFEKEPSTYTDENGNVFDAESGELLKEAGKDTVEPPTSAKNAGEFDELIDQEQRRIFEEMQDEGRVPDGMTFEEYKGMQAKQPSGGAYIDQMEAFLEANDDTQSASLLREIYNRYNGADPEGMEERLSGEDLPDLGDFYYVDSRGNVRYNVNEYIKLLEKMKGGPLSARESRKLSDALKNG